MYRSYPSTALYERNSTQLKAAKYLNNCFGEGIELRDIAPSGRTFALQAKASAQGGVRKRCGELMFRKYLAS